MVNTKLFHIFVHPSLTTNALYRESFSLHSQWVSHCKIRAFVLLLCLILAPHSLEFGVQLEQADSFRRGGFDSKDECVCQIYEEARQIHLSSYFGRPFSHFLWHLRHTKVPEARGEVLNALLKKSLQFLFWNIVHSFDEMFWAWQIFQIIFFLFCLNFFMNECRL